MIRLARLSDADQVLDIENTCFDDPGVYKLNASTIRYHIRLGDRMWVAYREHDHRSAAGYLLLSHASSLGQRRVYSVAVHQDAQGQGIGRRLMKHAIRKTRGRLTLEVDTYNVGARKLYESLGFREIGSYPHYYGRGHHAIRMERTK